MSLFTDSEGEIRIGRVIVTSILSIIVIAGLFMSFEVIAAGKRGVVLQWGAVDRVLGEGFYVINPISEDVVVMDVRVQKFETTATAASKDLQTVTSVVALNYHVDPKRVGELYQNIGKDYEAQVIHPALQESVKAGTALFTAEELISKRDMVKEEVRKNLLARLDKFNIIVDDFSIVNFDFSAQFNAAIEGKQVAEQQALQAKNDLEKVKFEAQQSIEQAKAQAESTKLQADALANSSQVIELRKVEAMLELAKRWDGKLPVNIYGSAPLPFLDVK